MREIKPRQRKNDSRTRQDEQKTGDEASLDAMEKPADIGRKLLRLGARQQHAIIQRMKITRLVDPLLLVDEDAVHHRDLRGRPAKGETADFERRGGEVAKWNSHAKRTQFVSAVFAIEDVSDRVRQTVGPYQN